MPDAADRWASPDPSIAVRGHQDTSSELHEERLEAAAARILESGASTVLDIGCGSGALLRRLAREGQLTRLVGLDASPEALGTAARLLSEGGDVASGRVVLEHGSFETLAHRTERFDAVALVEIIEHIDPARLSVVEHAVLETLRPEVVVITTPNREYNVLYGMAPDALRHVDHRFEWTRAKLRSWATGAAARCGYDPAFEDVGPVDAALGSPTQMVVLRRRSSR